MRPSHDPTDLAAPSAPPARIADLPSRVQIEISMEFPGQSRLLGALAAEQSPTETWPEQRAEDGRRDPPHDDPHILIFPIDRNARNTPRT